MMGLMTIVALIVGALIGWYVFRKSIDVLLSGIVFIPHSSRERFDDLFALADDETTSKFSAVKGTKTYADHLRLHEAVKPTAYWRFRKYYRSAFKVFAQLSIVTAIPAIIFWSHWYWYLIGAAVVIAGLFIQRYAKFGVGFYQRTMIDTIMSSYAKDKKLK